MIKTCWRCQTQQPLERFVPDKRCKDGRAGVCLNCVNNRQKTERLANPEKFRVWKKSSRYRITEKEYFERLEGQGGGCAICGIKPFELVNKQQVLYIDHNHTTHEVRGLLCPTCNSMVGYLDRYPTLLKRATEYLAMFEDE